MFLGLAAGGSTQVAAVAHTLYCSSEGGDIYEQGERLLILFNAPSSRLHIHSSHDTIFHTTSYTSISSLGDSTTLQTFHLGTFWVDPEVSPVPSLTRLSRSPQSIYTLPCPVIEQFLATPAFFTIEIS